MPDTFQKLKVGDHVHDRWYPLMRGLVVHKLKHRVKIRFFGGSGQDIITYDKSHANNFLVIEEK